jgi:putative protease
VENGADAIYFGLDRFNARMRANNFTEADLPDLMTFLHLRGVKGYITFNTLVFQNELAEAEQYVRTMIAAGVDAAIVQDVGICRLIRALSPDFPIHASTQMTVTSPVGVEFARKLGCNLVVLARECSLKEIGQMTAAGTTLTEHANPDPLSLPLEVFVHGALCVAYSGQCLTSEALGGRSANRGECAQACRMPYELVADGQLVPLGDRKYLLSPQDLAGLKLIPELARLGVASLKIEGRLKSPEYVANITRIYRKALDEVAAGIGTARDSSSSNQYEMEMAFSRGLYTGWFNGINNQELVHGRFGKKRGVYLGEVVAVGPAGVELRLQGPAKPGDGVVFDAGRPEEKEEGGRIYGIRTSDKGGSLLTFGRGDVDFRRVHPGDKLWKTSDPGLERRLRQSFEGDSPKYQRPVSIEAHGIAGRPLTIIARDDGGNISRVSSTMPLEPAVNRPLTVERLREQLGRLGGTPFRLGAVDFRIEGDVLVPISELNRMRRDFVADLDRQRTVPRRWSLTTQAQSGRPVFDACDPSGAPQPARPGEIDPVLLVRTRGQFEAALRLGAGTIYCELEDPRKYRELMELARGHRVEAGPPGSSASKPPKVFVAPPRIFKLGEEWSLNQVRSCNADGYLVRNYDHLKFFTGHRRIGDYSLNVANRWAAEYFIREHGLERVTASYDLNAQQLEALLRGAPPEWFEITIHQHIPMFHMEHCVFCAFLSKGTDYRNCGRPCDTRDLKLRDRVGAEHPVKADAGCRNTVFNALAQTGAEYVQKMMALGVRRFRMEFLNETPEQMVLTVSKYRQLFRGEITGKGLWTELRLHNQLGVTRGQIAG